MTTLTKVHHRNVYPAISPSSPLNSQVGRTVLITGSSSGIGLETAKAFITASALCVIILGRRQEPLTAAAKQLQSSLPPGSSTKILARQCDIADAKETDELWAGLKKERIEVNVTVLNAAKTGSMTVGSEVGKVWEFFEVNVLANLRMVERFLGQGPAKGKVRYLYFLRNRQKLTRYPGAGEYFQCFSAYEPLI
jgi:short-subunit dehydrogenase